MGKERIGRRLQNDESCIPQDGIYQPVTDSEFDALLNQLHADWQIKEGHLCREVRCKDYQQALWRTQRLAELAEKVQHHPRLVLDWCRVELSIRTHAINGLSRSDFIYAYLADQLLTDESPG